MATFSRTQSFSISIERLPEEVYAFVYDAANFPLWVEGCQYVTKEDNGWTMETSNSSMKLRFVEENGLGVLDYFVIPVPGMEIYFPMRVFPNGSGSEVTLTMFQLPGMTDEQFAGGSEVIEHDLKSLKLAMEANR
jgi:hypothetical protein